MHLCTGTLRKTGSQDTKAASEITNYLLYSGLNSEFAILFSSAVQMFGELYYTLYS